MFFNSDLNEIYPCLSKKFSMCFRLCMGPLVGEVCIHASSLLGGGNRGHLDWRIWIVKHVAYSLFFKIIQRCTFNELDDEAGSRHHGPKPSLDAVRQRSWVLGFGRFNMRIEAIPSSECREAHFHASCLSYHIGDMRNPGFVFKDARAFTRSDRQTETERQCEMQMKQTDNRWTGRQAGSVLQLG